MNKVKIVFAFFMTLICLVLILQNTHPVETSLLFFKFTLPSSALLALTLLIGIGVGILIALALCKKKERYKKGD